VVELDRMPVGYVRPAGVAKTPVIASAAVHVGPMNHWTLSGMIPVDVMTATMDVEPPADSEMLAGRLSPEAR